ncbi:MAG: MFS transporter, partial [Actinomycetota bacterium]
MFAPIRAMGAFRPSAAPGLLAGAAAVSGLFAASAFLIAPVADRFGVTVGAAGLISVVQVGGFTAATFVAGRKVRADGRILVGAALALVAANLVSAAVGWFWLLLVARLVAGVGAGLVTWLAWIDAMRKHEVMRDIAGIGPFTALVAAPLFGLLTSRWGDRPVFLVLAVLAAAPLAFRVDLSGEPAPGRRRMSPSRSNLVLLGALMLMTLAGSSMFIFTVAMADARIHLDPSLAAFAISANAAAGLAATRLRAGPGTAGLWLAGIAASISAIIAFPIAPVFYAAMITWGFCFWMAVPEVLRMVAAWSLAPAERVGDAQGLMALGRVAGPGVGGLLLGAWSYLAVGIEA